MRPNLLQWQRDGYPQFHRHRGNLVLHLFPVPAFIGATFSFVASLVALQPVAAVVSLVAMAVAFGVQGGGHKRESNPAIPFEGPGDTVTRIFAEQFITFPWFVLSGGWSRAYREAGRHPG